MRTPKLAPDANAFAESWVGSVKRECLDHFVRFSHEHLNHILAEFVRFYNSHRPHQGLGNRTLLAAATKPLIAPPSRPLPNVGRIRCQRTLGGLLRHYYRAAA